MKKYIIFILVFSFCFFTFSCSDVSNTNSKNNDNIQEDDFSVDSSQNISEETTLENLKFTEEDDGKGGGEILPRKYRNNYYQIPAFFAKIVDSTIYLEWEREYYAKNYPDDTNVMVMVDFIKEFNVSKEDFERANLEYAKFIDELYSHICLDPQDYADQEMQEIYNAEIIYTFDNEIINEYYLGINYPFLNEYQYDEAIANGTYKTRTTEFVDIEQMEAEIIAKYGEAEIVTEAAQPESNKEAISISEETTA